MVKKIEGEQKQEEYLQEKIYIQILERFKYIKQSDFEGYKLLLEEDG